MTTPYMTADFRVRSHKRSAKVYLSNLFTVEVVDFDGDSREYSVSAESFEEAAREAEHSALPLDTSRTLPSTRASRFPS